MDGKSLYSIGLLAVCFAVGGCAPQDASTIPVPTNLRTAALFDCADASIRDLHRRDEQWNARVTRRDVDAGRFETGDFGKSNVMGYRVQLLRRDRDPRATLSVRAAGPYFTDLGADRALSTFTSTLTACIAHSTPPH